MIIELTSYSELAILDAGGYGDSKITVNVKSYIGDAVVRNVTTKVLLDRDDITTWTGSVKDTVQIYSTADRIVIQPIIVDKDVLSDDDVSPPSRYIEANQISVGAVFANQTFSGSETSCKLNIFYILH
jgi:hypothetical protein